MKNQSPRHTATKALLFVALLLAGSLAWAAQVAGTIVNLSGPLLAKKADGTVKVMALKSEFEEGDTLVSEKNTYAQLKFIDSSEMTMKPGTTFTIEKFAYDAGKPEADNATFSLLKGGLRSITGLLGKRNKEKFALKTPSATIGIRGTTFIAQYVPPAIPNANGAPAAPPVLPPGLHVQVTDGMIVITNNGGSQAFQAGQFGYVPNVNQPPVIVPPNPGLHFVPPPAFNGTPPGGPTAGSPTPPGTASQDRNAVDCEVR